LSEDEWSPFCWAKAVYGVVIPVWTMCWNKNKNKYYYCCQVKFTCSESKAKQNKTLLLCLKWRFTCAKTNKRFERSCWKNKHIHLVLNLSLQNDLDFSNLMAFLLRTQF
jgi:hypothetical protein